MTRRALLASLFAAADPERLLWTPGKRLISIPKPRVLPPITLDAVQEMIRRYMELELERMKHMSAFLPYHFGSAAKIGDTITIRRPVRFGLTTTNQGD